MHKYHIKIQYGQIWRECVGLERGINCEGGGRKEEGREEKEGGRGNEPLESLIIVAGLGSVAKSLADVTVGPLVRWVAMVRGVGYRVGALGLSRAVFGVMEVKAVADVAEQTRRRLLLLLCSNKAGKTGVCYKDRRFNEGRLLLTRRSLRSR